MIIKWKASRWSRKPERLEFSGETRHFYTYPNRGRCPKASKYYVICDTEAEAQALLARFRAEAEQDRIDNNKRRFAVEAFELLEQAAGGGDIAEAAGKLLEVVRHD